ncbi:MAG: hypothetical protein C4343_00040 [Chloroflexota bacterium]
MGEAGLAATIHGSGRLVAVTNAHERHGSVVLTAVPGFVEANRYDQASVRRYRDQFWVPDGPSFGFVSRRAISEGGPRAWLLDDAIPVTPLETATPGLATYVCQPEGFRGAPVLAQLLLDATAHPRRWSGRIRLDRAAYPQLTEGGPLAPADRRPQLRREADGIVLEDVGLEHAVAIVGGAGHAHLDGEWVDVDLEVTRAVVIALGPNGVAALSAARMAIADPEALLDQTLEQWRGRWQGWPEPARAHEQLAKRALAYGLGPCSIPVRETICLVTDHLLLPLSWTRDAYYVADSLLAAARAGVASEEAIQIVRRHLAWLFGVAERPEGWWARSHLVGGQRKDPVFQLDQQLYPLLELAEYVGLTGDTDALERYRDEVDRVLAAIEPRRAAGGALFATDETPGDDPIELPYQTSNQILMWKTLTELDRLGLGGGRLRERAEAVRAATYRSLVTSLDDGARVFAYATDLRGRARIYHDANDLPLAFAPQWGFCPAHDPIWQATAAFAFSERNPGYFPGPEGGLGSVHTPGPWPLGHLQQLVIASTTDNPGWVGEAARRLERAAFWDGALPEASDARDGRPVSRPWFAWPGAVLLSLRLGASGRSPHEPA